MLIHECDRCGKQSKVDGEIVSFTAKYTTPDEVFNKIECELCAGCIKELEKWFVSEVGASPQKTDMSRNGIVKRIMAREEEEE